MDCCHNRVLSIPGNSNSPAEGYHASRTKVVCLLLLLQRKVGLLHGIVYFACSAVGHSPGTLLCRSMA